MTQMLVDVSFCGYENAVPFALGVLTAAAGLVLVYLWPPGRLFLGRRILRVPVIGRLFRLSATTLFSRALGILVESGVTLLDALVTVEQLFRNRYIAQRIAAARERVLRGGTLAEGIRRPHRVHDATATHDGCATELVDHRAAAAGTVTASLDEGVTGFQIVAFGPDGKTLATGGIDSNATPVRLRAAREV